MKRKFDAKLRKVGNSYVVTIPSETVDRFDLTEGDFLALEFDSDEFKKFSLEKENFRLFKSDNKNVMSKSDLKVKKEVKNKNGR